MLRKSDNNIIKPYEKKEYERKVGRFLLCLPSHNDDDEEVGPCSTVGKY